LWIGPLEASKSCSPLTTFLLSLCGDNDFDSLLDKFRLSPTIVCLLYENLILSGIWDQIPYLACPVWLRSKTFAYFSRGPKFEPRACSVCRLICAAIWRPNSTMKKEKSGHYNQRCDTKKPVGLRLSVLTTRIFFRSFVLVYSFSMFIFCINLRSLIVQYSVDVVWTCFNIFTDIFDNHLSTYFHHCYCIQFNKREMRNTSANI